MTFRTVLIDDEPLALKRLARLIEPHRDTIEIVGTAGNGAEAVIVINELEPDLVFLDIQMPELNGFDVLDRLDYTPLVIFTTAYDEYALRAFDVNSIDYLLKPVDPDRLAKAIDKLLRLSETGAGDLRRRIEQLITDAPGLRTHRIQVRLGDRIRLVPAEEVVYFRASDKYIEMHTHDKEHLITQSLAQLESVLPRNDFVRVHRSVKPIQKGSRAGCAQVG